jgi:hypothetical protein
MTIARLDSGHFEKPSRRDNFLVDHQPKSAVPEREFRIGPVADLPAARGTGVITRRSSIDRSGLWADEAA